MQAPREPAGPAFGNQFSTILAYFAAGGPNQVRKAMTTHKPRSDLLEVWLGFLEKIEGPKRRRAQELRRRRDNPKRRATNKGALTSGPLGCASRRRSSA
jgi:hypothetical protein